MGWLSCSPLCSGSPASGPPTAPRPARCWPLSPVSPGKPLALAHPAFPPPAQSQSLQFPQRPRKVPSLLPSTFLLQLVLSILKVSAVLNSKLGLPRDGHGRQRSTRPFYSVSKPNPQTNLGRILCLVAVPKLWVKMKETRRGDGFGGEAVEPALLNGEPPQASVSPSVKVGGGRDALQAFPALTLCDW